MNPKMGSYQKRKLFGPLLVQQPKSPREFLIWHSMCTKQIFMGKKFKIVFIWQLNVRAFLKAKSENPKESLDLLLSEHFPGSVALNGQIMIHSLDNLGLNTSNKEVNLRNHWSLKDSYVTKEKVLRATNSFGLHRIGGQAYFIKARVLKNLAMIKLTLGRKTKPFEAMIELDCIPISWGESLF